MRSKQPAQASVLRRKPRQSSTEATGLLLSGCGTSERERVERAAKQRWHARTATCTHRSGKLYGCVLLGAEIPVSRQFTNDFLTPQHRCFRAREAIIDVSMTSSGYEWAFGRAG
jgi:hypothetical protein